MTRRHNFQTFSWFHDLNQRGLLDLDPPYQRRSVWNQSFKDYFVETVILGYPSPAIFLFEELSEDGRSVFHVVDGKQRLTTLLEFANDNFPIKDGAKVPRLSGLYFSGLDSERKKSVWGYEFLVEYIPTNDEDIIDAMFDRLNRNVAKLSPQELRHARFDGEFMSAVEELSEWMERQLPKNFPRIAAQSRRQMKEVELVALILLWLEKKDARSYSQTELDKAFSDRDDDWEEKKDVEDAFRDTISFMNEIITLPGRRKSCEFSLAKSSRFLLLFLFTCMHSRRRNNTANRIYCVQIESVCGTGG